jgi:hypothetical protein
MKTLGQTLYDTRFPRLHSDWEDLTDWDQSCWETAAKAVATTVRAATIEECAMLVEDVPESVTNFSLYECHDLAKHTAAAIRSLALEKP